MAIKKYDVFCSLCNCSITSKIVAKFWGGEIVVTGYNTLARYIPGVAEKAPAICVKCNTRMLAQAQAQRETNTPRKCKVCGKYKILNGVGMCLRCFKLAMNKGKIVYGK